MVIAVDNSHSIQQSRRMRRNRDICCSERMVRHSDKAIAIWRRMQPFLRVARDSPGATGAEVSQAWSLPEGNLSTKSTPISPLRKMATWHPFRACRMLRPMAQER